MMLTCLYRMKMTRSSISFFIFRRFDRERSNDETLFCDCFCSIASKIEVRLARKLGTLLCSLGCGGQMQSAMDSE